MSFGLNGCSIRFLRRQSIKIAQLTQAPTTFSLYNLDTPGFFLSTLFKFYTHAVQNPEFCNKNIKIEINWIIKLSQKYLFRFYIYIHYLWKSKYGTLRYYLSVYSHLMWTMQSIFYGGGALRVLNALCLMTNVAHVCVQIFSVGVPVI